MLDIELTEEQAITFFRKHWDYLYQNPHKGKPDFPSFDPKNKDYIGIPMQHCFLCEFTDGDCATCLIAWPEGSCKHSDGYYFKWIIARDLSDRAKYAQLIRDLPEK